jgi:hypothetical protein
VVWCGVVWCGVWGRAPPARRGGARPQQLPSQHGSCCAAAHTHTHTHTHKARRHTQHMLTHNATQAASARTQAWHPPAPRHSP